ncbi:hypothetical protein [Pontibacter oryzae]|uniref:Uncharacterized protein n=1 Tax=Pontibacter oryzae TaxID=2304593 RepID=A0A399RQZ0_9BACT|nr:hypothetical protein [Pontibacter oryzae]RIJ34126.1 hypothetical protein D1627_17380 [Pontibacter oryzae]
MSRSLHVFLLLYISLFSAASALCQGVPIDTSFVRGSVENALGVYKNIVGAQIHLHTGSEYYNVAKPYMEGHRYFEAESVENGSILYDGAWFHDVPMLYDVVLDEVVIFHQMNGMLQKLVKQKVSSFVLGNHSFLNLEFDSTSGSSMRPGFYDVLYSGQVKVLSRRQKDVQVRTSIHGMEGNYNIIDKFYLRKDGAYYQVKTKRSILNVLEDEKKRLKKFARVNKLKFKRQREYAILSLAQHYETLKN